MVSYWVGGSRILSGGFLFCSVDFLVVAVLRPCLGFLSFGCRFGALSGWSLINSVCGMGVFSVWIPGGWGGRILPMGGLQLSGFGGGALVSAGCRDVGFLIVFGWL